MTPARATFVLSLHGGLIWGGLEAQAWHTKAALERRGWEVDILGPLTRSLGDIVHFFGTYEGYWDVALQVRERGIPYVCSPVFLPPNRGASLRRRALRKSLTDRTLYRGQRKLYEHAKRLIALTGAEVENLTSYFGGNLAPSSMIPNGLTVDLPLEEIPRQGVICLGRLEPRKNQLGLIRAMHGLNEPLLLIGSMSEGPYVSQCLAEADSKVEFVGSLHHGSEQLVHQLVRAKVFAMVSEMEVLSLAAIEAACAGARLVLSDTWGAESVFGEDALYVSPNDIAGIRKAIATQLQVQEAPEKIAERRRRYVSKFSWDTIAGQIESVYEEALRP